MKKLWVTTAVFLSLGYCSLQAAGGVVSGGSGQIGPAGPAGPTGAAGAAGADGTSTNIIAQDEGTDVSTTTVINFVGSNVAVTNTGSTITVTITGSAGGGAVIFLSTFNHQSAISKSTFVFVGQLVSSGLFTTDVGTITLDVVRRINLYGNFAIVNSSGLNIGTSNFALVTITSSGVTNKPYLAIGSGTNQGTDRMMELTVTSFTVRVPTTNIVGALVVEGALVVNSSGATVYNQGVVINNNGGGHPNEDFQVKGENEANLLYVDAGTDRVGIKTNTPRAGLEVSGDFMFITTVTIGAMFPHAVLNSTNTTSTSFSSNALNGLGLLDGRTSTTGANSAIFFMYVPDNFVAGTTPTLVSLRAMCTGQSQIQESYVLSYATMSNIGLDISTGLGQSQQNFSNLNFSSPTVVIFTTTTTLKGGTKEAKFNPGDKPLNGVTNMIGSGDLVLAVMATRDGANADNDPSNIPSAPYAPYIKIKVQQ